MGSTWEKVPQNMRLSIPAIYLVYLAFHCQDDSKARFAHAHYYLNELDTVLSVSV